MKPWIPGLLAISAALCGGHLMAQQAEGEAVAPVAPAAAPAPPAATPAADVAAPAAAEPTVEEVEVFLKRVDGMIASREEKAARLVNQMIENDKRIESGIASLVKMLSSVTDSRDSKTRVARLKQEFIDGLANAAKAYARKRAEVEEALRNTQNKYSREDLFKARGAIDKRIDNRVTQIVEVTSTFDAHKDLEKYIYHGGGGDGWNDWDGVWEDNPEYEQNKRATRAGDKADKTVAGELRKAIDRLETQQAALQEKRRTATNLTDTQKAELDKEIARLESLRQARIMQRDMLSSHTNQAPTQGISLKAAMNMDEEIEMAAGDLRQEFTELFSTFREWQKTRAQLADCLVRKDRAAAWLEAKKAGAKP